jgi:hypothetical protein
MMLSRVLRDWQPHEVAQHQFEGQLKAQLYRLLKLVLGDPTDDGPSYAIGRAEL